MTIVVLVLKSRVYIFLDFFFFNWQLNVFWMEKLGRYLFFDGCFYISPIVHSPVVQLLTLRASSYLFLYLTIICRVISTSFFACNRIHVVVHGFVNWISVQCKRWSFPWQSSVSVTNIINLHYFLGYFKNQISSFRHWHLKGVFPKHDKRHLKLNIFD